MQTAVQWRFCFEPRAEALCVPFVNQIDRNLMVSFAVDGEGDSDTRFVEGVWHQMKVADEEDRSRQCDVNRAREYQVTPRGVNLTHWGRSISRQGAKAQR